MCEFLCIVIKSFTENPVSIVVKSVFIQCMSIEKRNETTLAILDLKGPSVHAVFNNLSNISNWFLTIYNLENDRKSYSYNLTSSASCIINAPYEYVLNTHQHRKFAFKWHKFYTYRESQKSAKKLLLIYHMRLDLFSDYQNFDDFVQNFVVFSHDPPSTFTCHLNSWSSLNIYLSFGLTGNLK